MIKFNELLEKSGAGDWGTDELTQTLRKGTPGQGITDIGAKNKERKESVELDEANVASTFDDEYSKGVARGMAKAFKDSGFSGTVTSTKKGEFLIKSKNGELSAKLEFKSGGTKTKPVTDLVLKGTISNGGKIEKRLKLGRFTVWDSMSMRRGDPSETYGEDIAAAIQDSGHILVKKLIGESVELDEEKVIKIVADTNTRKYKEGEVIKTFPETKAGLTKAMVFQKTVKDRYGAETTMVRESVELDEARAARPPKLKGNNGPYTRQQIEKAAKEAKVDIGAKSRMMMALRGMNEETEELDELDSKTYRSYHDKATADQLKRMSKAKRSKEDQRIMRKRSLGIATAGMKQYGDKRSMGQRIRGEEVELDEGAVAVSTVEKEIRKNGGTQVKKSDREITFIYKGSERKIPVDRGFVKSDHYMKIQDMMEDLQERPFGGDSVLKDLMPGAYNFLDKTINNRRYQFAIRMFLDLRKKNPNDARNNLIKAAKIADVDVRVLDKLFRNMVKKGVMPKHLMNYYPTFVEDITEKLKVSDGLGAWIKDFQDSDAPQFKDADSKKRRDMAIAAFTAAGGKLGEELEEGSESWESGYKRRVVKTTKPEHKEKGYNWRIKGKDRPEISIKLYKEKPSFDEFKKQMKRVAGHEFGG